jgi:hypothetical protein
MLLGIYIFGSQRMEILELAKLLDFGMSGKFHAEWQSARYCRRKIQCSTMRKWECGSVVEQYQNVCHILRVIRLGKSTVKQESHGLRGKWLVKWTNEGSGIMSTLKKEGRSTEDWQTHWKEPQVWPKEYFNSICDKIMEFQRSGHYYFMYMKTRGTRLERRPWDSKQWLWWLSRECNILSSKSIENWGELY